MLTIMCMLPTTFSDHRIGVLWDQPPPVSAVQLAKRESHFRRGDQGMRQRQAEGRERERSSNGIREHH